MATTAEIIAKQKKFAQAIAEAKKSQAEYEKQFSQAQMDHSKTFGTMVKHTVTKAVSLYGELQAGLARIKECIKNAEDCAKDFDMAYRKMVDSSKYLAEMQKNLDAAKKKNDTAKTPDAKKGLEIAQKAFEKAKRDNETATMTCKMFEADAEKPLKDFEGWQSKKFNARCIKFRQTLGELARALDMAMKDF